MGLLNVVVPVSTLYQICLHSQHLSGEGGTRQGEGLLLGQESPMPVVCCHISQDFGRA